jgi:hypothetical protein
MKKFHKGYDHRDNVKLSSLDFAHGGGHVWGGPYRAASMVPGKAFRINMAKEVVGRADLLVPTVDFGLPNVELFKFALLEAGRRLMRGESVFVGCGYGYGRTGTFIAVLYKLNREVLYLLRRGDFGDCAFLDPVYEVRKGYRPEAVETAAQEAFVRDFDTWGLARRLAFREKPPVLFDKRLWGL